MTLLPEPEMSKVSAIGQDVSPADQREAVARAADRDLGVAAQGEGGVRHRGVVAGAGHRDELAASRRERVAADDGDMVRRAVHRGPGVGRKADRAEISVDDLADRLALYSPGPPRSPCRCCP